MSAFRHKPHVHMTPALERRIEYYLKHSDYMGPDQIADRLNVSRTAVYTIKRRLNEKKEANTQAKD